MKKILIKLTVLLITFLISVIVFKENSFAQGIQTKYPVELYGYIKLDAAYDTSRTDVGNFARWVEHTTTNSNDAQFNMTANQSRFGLKFKGPEKDGAIKTSGRVELDFYGGGAENKSLLMLRHCFLQVDWLKSGFSLIAGQTADVMSPLVPNTINYSVAWWAGNIGYRRPQVRLTKGVEIGDSSKLLVQAAIARTIGDANDFGPGDTGEDSGLPSIQGRVAYSIDKTVIGISGHYGIEEYDTDNTGSFVNYDSWSVNLDLYVPIAEKVAFKGELWTGTNMDAYLGGIGQGVTSAQQSIRSAGGWIALDVKPFCFGCSMDDPNDIFLVSGNRSKNVSIFGNIWCDIDEAVKIGLEVSYWGTDYIAQTSGQNLRVQSSLIYKF